MGIHRERMKMALLVRAGFNPVLEVGPTAADSATVNSMPEKPNLANDPITPLRISTSQYFMQRLGINVGELFSKGHVNVSKYGSACLADS
eukprot:scaffold81872_cov75-Cyclotella_meneghiniana.AAC.2